MISHACFICDWICQKGGKGLSLVTINLDGFSLANCRRFAKLSTHQTFPLYGTTLKIYVGKIPLLSDLQLNLLVAGGQCNLEAL